MDTAISAATRQPSTARRVVALACAIAVLVGTFFLGRAVGIQAEQTRDLNECVENMYGSQRWTLDSIAEACAGGDFDDLVPIG